MRICDFLGVIGCLLSLGVYITPIPTIYNEIKRGILTTFTQTYFFIGILQSTFYAGFGYQQKDYYILFVSMTTYILFLTYLNIHIYFTGPYKNFVYFNSGSILLFALSINKIPKDTNLYMAVFMACFWQSTGVPNIRLALANKDITFVNILLSYSSFFNFIIWLVYGLIIGIYLLSFQSIVTVVFMFTNIYIYHWAMGKISDEDPFILLLHRCLFSDLVEKPVEEEYDVNEMLNNLRNSDIFYRN